MTQETLRRIKKSKGGFTLIELLVVVLIIGILAAIAVPQYFKVVEKGKAAEALSTVDSIRGAQERYLTNTGAYCGGGPMTSATCMGWDMQVPVLRYFNMGNPVANTTPGWNIALTRNASPAVYANYTVTYTVVAGGKPTATCSNLSCQQDLMPN
jgi:prepilin-type N-terminal cleavage/methylation domain-containing protein